MDALEKHSDLFDSTRLTKGILVTVMGGLGNQIFTHIGAYILAKTHNVPLFKCKEDPTKNKHNKKLQLYNTSIFKYIGHEIPFSSSDRDLHIVLSAYNYKQYSHTAINPFAEYNPIHITPNVVCIGYFQYYPPIKPYEDEIRSLLLKGLNSEIKSIQHLDNSHTSAFLHIRRGDYLEYADIHFIQDLEYYKSAVLTLLVKNPSISKIYIFSDDMEWVRQQDYFKQPLFEYTNIDDELETLATMSQCTAGAICANSTFSWWGAFLGAHGKRSPVIVPKKWVNQTIENLFPEEWIII